MITASAILLVSTLAFAADTTVTLGKVERDLTGDGVPETLKLVGTGRAIDSLDVTFTIESAGVEIYFAPLRPLTRRIGFDAKRSRRTPAEHRALLKDFGSWFFGDRKFQSPAQFLTWLESSGRRHIALIPEVIARDMGTPSDTARAADIWREIERSGVTLFQFSAGGDLVTVIGWSARNKRFYRLLECC